MDRLDDRTITERLAILDRFAFQGLPDGPLQLVAVTMKEDQPSLGLGFLRYRKTGRGLVIAGPHWGEFLGSLSRGEMVLADGHDDLEGHPLAGEIYRHHKGGRYEVLATGRGNSDGARYIAYRSIDKGYRWARTPYGFLQLLQRLIIITAHNIAVFNNRIKTYTGTYAYNRAF